MKKFSYYCDKEIKWIDVYSLTDNNQAIKGKFEVFDESVAVKFAMENKYPSIGYDQATKNEADRLNQQARIKFLQEP